MTLYERDIQFLDHHAESWSLIGRILKAKYNGKEYKIEYKGDTAFDRADKQMGRSIVKSIQLEMYK